MFKNRGRDEVHPKAGAGTHLGWGFAFGGFLFLQTSLLSLPNAIAGWSGGGYEVYTLLIILLTFTFLIPSLQAGWSSLLHEGVKLRVGLGLLIGAGLMAGYFLDGPVAGAGLLLAHVGCLSLWLLMALGTETPSKAAGGALSLAFVLVLLLNFLNAFAFTYPYTLPAMRDLGWAVYLAAGILVLTGVFHRKAFEPRSPIGADRHWAVAMLGVFALALIFVWPKAAGGLPEDGALRIATYNIHYGYDDVWHYTLEEMAKTIEEAGGDVVTMQEVDVGRLTSYAVDNAYYLSRRLRMQVAYLPTVEHLTGIAVLYRGPEVEERFQLLTSLQEQTGIIQVPLQQDDNQLHVFGTWLGLSNEDTERQVEETLEFIGDATPAAFGGDFNAEPETREAEAIRKAGFSDPFVTLGYDPIPDTSPAIQPRHQIDYVWLRGVSPLKARVSESLASDHRMVVVEVRFP
jgi:endonuclease/exonuclease/phosphatase family metal-dependent hydrolase